MTAEIANESNAVPSNKYRKTGELNDDKISFHHIMFFKSVVL